MIIAVPDKPASPLTIVSYTFENIVVSWTASSDNNGPITAYTISWTYSDKKKQRQSGSKLVGKNVLSYTITPLLPYTDYEITYKAVNGAGNSASSEVRAVKTKEKSERIPIKCISHFSI